MVFGMGILWYFELLSFALQEEGKDENNLVYFTDSINMLQGVWIFFIYVLKQNVLRNIKDEFTTLKSSLFGGSSSS